jgi:hypothetical protein
MLVKGCGTPTSGDGGAQSYKDIIIVAKIIIPVLFYTPLFKTNVQHVAALQYMPVCSNEHRPSHNLFRGLFFVRFGTTTHIKYTKLQLHCGEFVGCSRMSTQEKILQECYTS